MSDRIASLPFDRVPRWRLWMRRDASPSTRRIGVIVTALAIAVAGVVLPLRLFGEEDVTPRSSGSILLTTIGVVEDGSIQHDLATIDLDSGAVTTLARTPADESVPAWSPDGTRIMFIRSARTSDLVVADADGSNERVVLSDVAGSLMSPAWTPDGEGICYVDDGGIRVVDLQTGDDSLQMRFARFDVFVAGGISWSPDGSRVAFIAIPANDDFGLSYLYVADVDGEHVERVVQDPVLDLRTRPAWSPDGKVLAYQDVSNEIHTVHLSTGDDVQLTDAATDSGTIVGLSTSPTFSPDGTRIAFLRNRENGIFDAYVMDADGENLERVTRLHNASLESLSWGPPITPS